MSLDYPKRLIEVDLPIKRISAHARREKSIRHGHISTLHIWWARRPLAACRAVICAALWPDPADEKCPPAFRAEARRLMTEWAKNHLDLTSPESMSRFNRIKNDPEVLADNVELRKSLLDFIADFSNWDNLSQPAFLDTCRTLTKWSHESLSPAQGTRPLVIDPFAGGGSIPLEAMRAGADIFASDLNPIPVIINKLLLEYVPNYGTRLADAVKHWGDWILAEAKKQLADLYPPDDGGDVPIAYLWARTIRCEGPGCRAHVPMIRSLWLAKKASRETLLEIIADRDNASITFGLLVRCDGRWVNQSDQSKTYKSPPTGGTVQRGAATCPLCGFTTPVQRIRNQLKPRHGGSDDSVLTCVLVLARDGRRYFRLPLPRDIIPIESARSYIKDVRSGAITSAHLPPDVNISLNEVRRINVPLYGMSQWSDLFSSRQLACLCTLAKLVQLAGDQVRATGDVGLGDAVQTSLGCVLSKALDRNTALARWEPNVLCSQQVFGRQAIAMVWDYGEPSLLEQCAGSWQSMMDVWIDGLNNVIESLKSLPNESSVVVQSADASNHPLPDDSADALITDPPYYDAVPYSHLSDFFYVWHQKHLHRIFPDLFSRSESPKEPEIVVDRSHSLSTSTKDKRFYERELTRAFMESRRVVKPDGIGVIVFASKSTASWEAILNAVVEAGWTVTGSWPIDTEMGTRMNAQDTATLASSVHIVVRPREAKAGALESSLAGDWRSVLAELPKRIHEWMPRLAEEGVVGADAIFACLGPALEIFSRYSRVEKASGEVVSLREYLEQVWAAVSTEALSMIFRDADAAGLESDARFTAIVLWTLGTGAPSGSGSDAEEDDDSDDEEDDDAPKGKPAKGGFALEYDAARKIAQGLGVNLEQIDSVVEVKGDKARLLPVSERAAALFGKAEKAEAAAKKRGKKVSQKKLFDTGEKASGGGGLVAGISDGTGATPGATVLDRIHQSMLLFAGGRADALKRFIVEDGVGADARFWKLAQSLSALYPAGSEEKRWVDGVLARKKSFGF